MTDAPKASGMLESGHAGPVRVSTADCFVLVIDLQDRLVPAIRDGDAVLAAAGRLVRGAARLGVPVRATEHCADAIGATVAPLRGLLPDGHRLAKRRFDATSEDGLAASLKALRRPSVVVAGAEAHVCVAQTALGLLAAGWRVLVAEDACGSRRMVDREAGIARLRAAGCIPLTVEALLFEWLGGADHPAFRDVLSIIKEAR